ncbi:hypothetical protein [Natrarchaeobaculum sulfurireducens]|uniref:Uncharacterized protein n=1 Tax=Natrarchaeobaculum sulfurireducens TaxID=2044521 RepID=A0A346PRZ2_9EURY|nr:hypothetical protein [Natrarchaeobaculum sulfurireducens]AXR77715.1 hypothetical protein AArc1_1381 [Natrarchaeobaculum sulfurireducens]AXR82287.1 hypothetical protein AArcMg_2290 [Natrarchaeobaculum sulfurireducens]
MAGEHSDQPSAGDDSEESAAGGLEPTGGPRRVVSEQSVDDILASLEETTDSTKPVESTESTEPTPKTTAGSSEPSELANSDRSPTSDFDVDETTVCGVDDDSDDDHNSSDGSDDDHNSSDGSDDTVDHDDITSDELADLDRCLEHDEITGADVRAAEAGVGRESTPDVGDLDLSMDDLKRTAAELDGDSLTAKPSESPSDDPTVPDDPGSIARATDPDRTEPPASDDSKETTGVLGRLKRLFSR